MTDQIKRGLSGFGVMAAGAIPAATSAVMGCGACTAGAIAVGMGPILLAAGALITGLMIMKPTKGKGK